MKIRLLLLCAGVSLVAAMMPSSVSAQEGFSVQVTPSPIVETIKPGESKTVELKIRNTASKEEEFKMSLRSFEFDDASGEVKLLNSEPQEVVEWVTFESPVFRIQAGEIYTQRVRFAMPQNAGFNYNFAIVVSRANPTPEEGGKATIEGSVAIFTLLTVDRPDAIRRLEVSSLKSNRNVYEFLPSNFELTLKNTGNVVVRPGGNIFIQRAGSDGEPISVLEINPTDAYILPGSSRSVSNAWNDGFPVRVTQENGETKLKWNWGELQKLRIGRYTAKAIVLYNDGSREVPVEISVTFWVLPWRLLAGLAVVIVILAVGAITIIKKTLKFSKHKDEQAA